MERQKITANRRDVKGTGAARRLRTQGLIPAVFYGPKIDSTPISCDAKELRRILLQHGLNVLIDLKIKDETGAKKESTHVAMVRDLQLDPLRGIPIHADLFAVSMKETMTFEVPIRLVGKPEGTKVGGILEQIRREVEVECLPADVPSHFEVDVSHLEIGDSIHVQEMAVEKVKLLTEPHMTIATLVPPVVEKEPEPEEMVIEGEEEEEAPAEGEKESAEEKGE
jgi:large subunit ribosomal protein L25